MCADDDDGDDDGNGLRGVSEMWSGDTESCVRPMLASGLGMVWVHWASLADDD